MLVWWFLTIHSFPTLSFVLDFLGVRVLAFFASNLVGAIKFSLWHSCYIQIFNPLRLSWFLICYNWLHTPMNISTFFPLEDCSLIFADVKWILYLFSAINAYFFWLVVFGVLFAYKSTTFLLLILQIFLCFVIYVSHPKDLELFALFCFKVECILVINNDVESTSLICFLLLCVRNYFFFFFAFLDVFCMTKMGANNFKEKFEEWAKGM